MKNLKDYTLYIMEDIKFVFSFMLTLTFAVISYTLKIFEHKVFLLVLCFVFALYSEYRLGYLTGTYKEKK